MSKEVYENGAARLEVITHDDGTAWFWIQAGIAGLRCYPDEFADLYELMHAYMEEYDG